MSDPTPAMKQRSEAWLAVVDHVEAYLKAAAQRYDGIFEATTRLSREMPQPTNLDSQFAPVGKGGIQDLFAKLWWDLNLPDGKAAENASNIIKNELLKDVSLLRADLNRSITDFDDMSASFISSNDKSLAPSKAQDSGLQKRIIDFERAVNEAELGRQPEIDPYILKLQLDRKIESYVRKHNRQADSFAYVQDAAKRVDGEVTERLQAILRKYTDIVEQNAQIIASGAQNARNVFINQPKLFEYKYWLGKSSSPSHFSGNTSISVTEREYASEMRYPKENSPYAKAIRVGTLERRAKFLHTYSAGEYVLTPLSLIEIRQNSPVWSIDLVGAKLRKDHKAAADEDQFVIQAKQHGSSSGKQHSFVFRAKVAANWIRDLENITTNSGGGPPLSSYESAKSSNAAAVTKSPESAAPVYREAVTEKKPEYVPAPTVSAPVTGDEIAHNTIRDNFASDHAKVGETSHTPASCVREQYIPDGAAAVTQDDPANNANLSKREQFVYDVAAPASFVEPSHPETSNTDKQFSGSNKKLASDDANIATYAEPAHNAVSNTGRQHATDTAPSYYSELAHDATASRRQFAPSSTVTSSTDAVPNHNAVPSTHGQVAPVDTSSHNVAKNISDHEMLGSSRPVPVSSDAVSFSDIPSPLARSENTSTASVTAATVATPAGVPISSSAMPPTSASCSSGTPVVPTHQLSGVAIKSQNYPAPSAETVVTQTTTTQYVAAPEDAPGNVAADAPMIISTTTQETVYGTEESDSEVSDVDPYSEDGTLAWKAERDMAEFH